MKKYLGLILEINPDSLDNFVEEFRTSYPDIKIIYLKTSYDKIWVTAEIPKGANHG
jgi:hypothetical protein